MKKLWSILIVCLLVMSCETSQEAYYREMTEKLKEGPELTIFAPTIYFESNSAELSDKELAKLIRISNMMRAEKEAMTYVLYGHTDNVESPDNQIELSLQRAQRVKEIIIQRGFPSYMFVAKGMGSNDPMAFNNTEQGRANNRRVTFSARRNTTE